MKKGLLFFVFLFLTTTSFAMPELSFQGDIYSPSETAIGTITDSLSNLNMEDIEIFEGRRSVLFERGIIKFENKNYLYIIFPKEGQFIVKVEKVLYNSTGGVKSIDLQKEFNIIKKNNSASVSISPGVYEGDYPELILTNLKTESIIINVSGKNESLAIGESKKIKLMVPQGLSFINIENYSIPIISTKLIVIENTTNITSINDTQNYSSCLQINTPKFVSTIINQMENYSLNITNNCNKKISLTISSNYSGFKFYEKNITIEDYKNINFSILCNKIGASSEFIKINSLEKTLPITINCLENKTILEIFNNNTLENIGESCESKNGKFCGEDETCTDSNSFLDSNVMKPCCLSECAGLYDKKTNWVSVLVSIVGILIIGIVIYLLIQRSKKLKSPRAEDKFKDIEKKYQKDVGGNKK